jgi:hypothetical protein
MSRSDIARAWDKVYCLCMHVLQVCILYLALLDAFLRHHDRLGVVPLLALASIALQHVRCAATALVRVRCRMC